MAADPEANNLSNLEYFGPGKASQNRVSGKPDMPCLSHLSEYIMSMS